MNSNRFPSPLTALGCTALFFLPCALNAAAPFSTVISQDSGQPFVIGPDGVFMGFGAYNWGPDWGAARRKTGVEVSDGAAVAKTDVGIPQGGGSYEVVTRWTRPAADQLRAEATLTGLASTPITLAVLSISPEAFAGGTLEVTAAGGEKESITLPIGQRPVGEAVQSLLLRKPDGTQATILFDQPVAIAADRGDLRIILAKDQVAQGQENQLAFTVQLPGATDFFADTDQIPDTQEGWFPFTGESPVPPNSEWNMQSWLEVPAGKHGRILAQADRLIYNNRPIKLWGINVSYSATAPNKALADRRADFYAANGINAVRLHKYADGSGWAGILEPGTAARLDPSGLDRMDYFVSALKNRGIYTKLSPVFIIKPGAKDKERIPYLDEFEKAGNGENLRYNPRHGALYISSELQDLLADQLKAILTHKNPHTGLTYAGDPAIAYVEIYNEDSALFGGVTNVLRRSPTLRARTGERFAKWLREKYGTEDAFKAAWGPQALNNSILKDQNLPLDESWAENRIYPAGNPWFFDPANLNTSQAPFARRLLDTMLFLKEIQDETYAKLSKVIRDTGYKGEIIASNWHAGRQMSHFYNLHSDSLIGTIDRHNYFGDGARGSSGPINAASMVSSPGGGTFSSGLNQVANRPFMLSEWIHVFSNEWGVEGPSILGAYGLGLQGWDVSYPFQNRDEGTWSYSIGAEAWDAAAPHFLGIFPAVSRQVHRGDVKESPVVHTRNVHIPSLDEQKVGFEETTTQDMDVKTFDSDVFPSAALAVGRGVVSFTEEFTPTPAFDLASHKDAEGALLSVTKQLRWRPGRNARDGHFEINSPGTQAVVGFAKGRKVELADAIITPESRFGAIYLTAQSPEKTIANDKGVLVTAIARSRNRDQRVLNDVFLARSGAVRNAREPGNVLMEPVTAKIELKRPGNPVVHILDHTGVRTGETVPISNGSFTIDTGRDKTPFYLITW